MNIIQLIYNKCTTYYYYLQKRLTTIIYKRCKICWFRTYDDSECGSIFNVCSKCYPNYWRNRFYRLYIHEN